MQMNVMDNHSTYKSLLPFQRSNVTHQMHHDLSLCGKLLEAGVD